EVGGTGRNADSHAHAARIQGFRAPDQARRPSGLGWGLRPPSESSPQESMARAKPALEAEHGAVGEGACYSDRPLAEPNLSDCGYNERWSPPCRGRSSSRSLRSSTCPSWTATATSTWTSNPTFPATCCGVSIVACSWAGDSTSGCCGCSARGESGLSR